MAEYVLTLYVAGKSARSATAIHNLREICEQHLKDRYQLEIVDILEHPDRAETEQILVTPTLVLEQPHKGRRIVGDLSATDRVLVGLGLRQSVWSWRRATS